MVQSLEKVLSRFIIGFKSDLEESDINDSKILDKIYHDAETCVLLRRCYYAESETMKDLWEIGLDPKEYPRLYKNADSQRKSGPFFDRSLRKPIKALGIQLEDRLVCFPLDYCYWQLLAVSSKDVNTIVTSLEVLDFPFSAKNMKLETCFRMSGDPSHLKLLFSYYFEELHTRITDSAQKEIDELIAKGLPQNVFLEMYATKSIYEVKKYYYDAVPSFEISSEIGSCQELNNLFTKNLNELKTYNEYSGEYEIMADDSIERKVQNAFKKTAEEYRKRIGSCVIFPLLPQ